jgi:hypothetical protein
MVIAGKKACELGLILQKTYRPNTIVAAATNSNILLPILADKKAEKSTFYVCFDKTCKQPVDTIEAAIQQLPKLPKTKQ